jgi:GH25 family lysozyme M1 (1,4-beta-N-acetylmuramidase)
VQKLTDRPPIIYCSPSFWTGSVGNPTNNLNCPLWIANWGVSSPTVPRAWSTWTFWQYSSTGTTPGVSGNVDLDYFNGSATQLQKLTFPHNPPQNK